MRARSLGCFPRRMAGWKGILLLGLLCGLGHCGHLTSRLAGILPPMRLRFESGGDKARPEKGPAPVYPGRGEFSKTSAKYPLPYLSPALTYRNPRDLSTPKSEIDIESEKCRGMKFVQDGIVFEWDTPSQDEISRRVRYKPRWGFFLANPKDCEPVDEWWKAKEPAVELWTGFWTFITFLGHVNVERAKVYLTHVFGGSVDEIRPLPKEARKSETMQQFVRQPTVQQSMKRARAPYAWWDYVEGMAMNLRGGGGDEMVKEEEGAHEDGGGDGDGEAMERWKGGGLRILRGGGAIADVLMPSAVGRKEAGWPFSIDWNGTEQEFREQCCEILERLELPTPRSVEDVEHTPDDRPLWGSRGAYLQEELCAKYSSFDWYARMEWKYQNVPAYRRRARARDRSVKMDPLDVSDSEGDNRDDGDVPGTEADDWKEAFQGGGEDEEEFRGMFGDECGPDPLECDGDDFIDKFTILGPDGKPSPWVPVIKHMFRVDPEAQERAQPILRDLSKERRVAEAIALSVPDFEDTRVHGADSIARLKEPRSMRAKMTPEKKALERDVKEAFKMLREGEREGDQEKIKLAESMLSLIEPAEPESYAGFTPEESIGYYNGFVTRAAEASIWAELTYGGHNERALWQAAGLGLRRQVLDVVEAGADVNAMDGWGRTSLHHAVYLGLRNGTCVSVLLKCGANVNAQDDDGWTPLCRAVFWGRYHSAVRLLDAGADTELETLGLRRALHLAAWAGQVECVRLLLSRGADVRALDEDGASAMDLAEERGFNKTMGLLRRALRAVKSEEKAAGKRWVQEMAYNGTELEGMDNLPEAPAPYEPNPRKYIKWYYDDLMRSYKKVQQDIFMEQGLDPKWVDKIENEYRKVSKKGWTRLMDKMRNEEKSAMLGKADKTKKKTRRGGLLVGPRKNQPKAEGDVRQRGGAKRGREEHKGGSSSSSVALVRGHKDEGSANRGGVVEQALEEEESSEWWQHPVFKEYWAMTPVCDRMRRDPIYMNSTEWKENAWHPSMKGKKNKPSNVTKSRYMEPVSSDSDFGFDFDD